MSIYKGGLNHGSKQSIPYLERKNNPVKHILALCNILWQRNRGKVSEKAGRYHVLDALPRYATQHGITAKRCFRALCYLIALDRPGSVKLCQDMLHRHCQQRGKITVGEGCGRILVAFFPAGKMEAFFREVTRANAMPPQDPGIWRAYGMK